MLNPKTYLWKWGFEPPKMCRFLQGYFFIWISKKKGVREWRDKYPKLTHTRTWNMKLSYIMNDSWQNFKLFLFFMQFNLVHFMMLHLVVIEHNAPTIGWHLQTSQHLDFYNVSWKVNNGNVFNVSYNWHNQLGNQNMDLCPSFYLYLSL
jgi:hypothetical protein